MHASRSVTEPIYLKTSISVVVVSPSIKIQQMLQERLSEPRWHVIEAGGGAQALELLRSGHAIEDGFVLLDPMLPDLEPNELADLMRSRFPYIHVLLLNSHTGRPLVGNAPQTAVSIRLIEELNSGPAMHTDSVQDSHMRNTHDLQSPKPRLRNMIGDSNQMQQVYSLTRMVAARDTTVLLTGESGTGKDLIAQQIHEISPRRKQPFVVVNCSAIPEHLLESELFGYTKGSFTGAVQSSVGRVHAAHGGTLLLDEIGDMPFPLQSKILRFLEQGEVQRIGSTENLKVDVRVVAATNVDLKQLISQQKFREDLYYRLAVFPIHIPSLRDRMNDLEELAVEFTARFSPRSFLSKDALQVLAQHHWPGNVRELRNVIERATILAGVDQVITPEHIVL